MQFVTDIYRATCAFPREELYGLSSQLRPFRCQAISLKGKHIFLRENSTTF
jgi:hypothetical protein